MDRTDYGGAPRPSTHGEQRLGGVAGGVRGWVELSRFSASVVARRAGVSNSTLHRVMNDQVDPSIGTLREIAVACEVELALNTRPLADAAAAAAARVILEAGYLPSLPAVDLWIKRLGRQAGDDPIQIVEAAGRASSPLLRLRPGRHPEGNGRCRDWPASDCQASGNDSLPLRFSGVRMCGVSGSC
jgi:transcriptional regulator with XRE-family HTH domain